MYLISCQREVATLYLDQVGHGRGAALLGSVTEECNAADGRGDGAEDEGTAANTGFSHEREVVV